MDLQEQLDRAIGHGPPLPAPEERLLAGRIAARRRRSRMVAGSVLGAVAVALPVALSLSLAGTSDSQPAPAGPSTVSDATPGDDDANGTSDGVALPATEGLNVVVVDGVPELSGHPSNMSIGPVVRESETAFGLQVRLHGKRSFVLMRWSEQAGWHVQRTVKAEPGEDLVTWLRGNGWLPTGENP